MTTMAVHKTAAMFRRAGPLFILDQKSNYQETISILELSGLSPISSKAALSHSKELIENLKGKGFYLSDKEISVDGMMTFDGKGNMHRATNSESVDQRVRVWPGKGAVYLHVSEEALGNRRFALFGERQASWNADVVVGVRKRQPIKDAKRE